MNIKQIIKEEVNDFDWIEEIPSKIYVGLRFTVGGYRPSSGVYTIAGFSGDKQSKGGPTVIVSWDDVEGDSGSTGYTMDTVDGFFKNNEWVPYYGG